MDRSELQVTTTELLGPKLAQLQQWGLGVAVVGLLLTIVGAVLSPKDAFYGYHWAWLFWLGPTAGSVGVLALHHTVGGGWGFVLRRMLEAGIRMLPVMLVLFIPIALSFWYPGSPLFPWHNPDIIAHDAIIQAKQGYLNVPFFIGRIIFYFLVWAWLGYGIFIKLGNTQDERADPVIFGKLSNWGARGLVIFCLVDTFVAVDLVMSLMPHWFSSILGMLLIVSQGLTTLALMILLAGWMGGNTKLIQDMPKGYLRDLGNLMLAFVMLWGYMSLSQYLITYSGNTAEEITWYWARRIGGWGAVSIALVPFHFFLPFGILLVGSRIKRNPHWLAWVSLFILFMRAVDVWWWVIPTFRSTISVSAADIGCFLLIGGIWLYGWSRNLLGRKVLPLHDPRLEANLGELVAHHA